MNISPINLNVVSTTTISQPTTPSPEEAAERTRIVQAVKAINESNVLGENNELTFVLDRRTHRALMRVVDRKTHEVVMQVPPEYVLRVAEELQRKTFG